PPSLLSPRHPPTTAIYALSLHDALPILPAHRADALALPLMVEHGQDPRGTAYTVAVDAAAGVTTGISAADRARTLRVLGDPASRSEEHTSELQSRENLVCRLLLDKKKQK